MILSKLSFFKKNDNEENDYRIKMLKRNKIDGLLVMSKRNLNGDVKYYYDVNSLIPLSQLFERKYMGYEQIHNLITGCIQTFKQIREYLLDSNQLLVHPDYIYVDSNSGKPFLAYYPDYDGNLKIGFMELMDYIITRLDHSDEKAVELGYKLYRYTRNDNYAIDEVMHEMFNVSCEIATVEEPYEYDYEEENEVVTTPVADKSKKNFILSMVCVVVAIVGSILLISNKELGNIALYIFVMTVVSLITAAILLYVYVKQNKNNSVDVIDDILLQQ